MRYSISNFLLISPRRLINQTIITNRICIKSQGFACQVIMKPWDSHRILRQCRPAYYQIKCTQAHPIIKCHQAHPITTCHKAHLIKILITIDVDNYGHVSRSLLKRLTIYFNYIYKNNNIFVYT